MILEKYKGKDGKWYIQPRYKRDMAIFMHCANGKDRIPSRKERELTQLLFLHGINYLSVEKVDSHKLLNDGE